MNSHAGDPIGGGFKGQGGDVKERAHGGCGSRYSDGGFFFVTFSVFPF